jgi:hypothetical protein
MKHTFKDVLPGIYRAVVRLKFANSFFWPIHDTMYQTQFRTQWLGKREEENMFSNSISFPSENWKKLKDFVESSGNTKYDIFP